ncbi:MAG TPA: hypothetical protein VNT24_06735 [Propionibacteriaceae bacterium]|nr:hypothetical protein [Propionibacteriaceae bacterium]
MKTPIALGAGVAMLLTGCGASPPQSDPTPSPTPAITSATPLPSSPLPSGSQPVDLDPAQFTTEIDHPYWPMKPGTRWTYREVEDGQVNDVALVVTTQTKKLANGVTARVVRDTVRTGGSIIEDTFDWYAQDAQGNLWYLGEDTAEFENGKITSRGGSFEAGVDGALPGIMIPADPAPGMRYRQEYYAGEAEDNGEVLSTADMVQVPAGRYRGALLTKDTITIEPDVQEYKLYARGVGPVLTLGVSGGSSREELVKIDQAPPSAGTGPLGRPNS